MERSRPTWSARTRWCNRVASDRKPCALSLGGAVSRGRTKLVFLSAASSSLASFKMSFHFLALERFMQIIRRGNNIK